MPGDESTRTAIWLAMTPDGTKSAAGLPTRCREGLLQRAHGRVLAVVVVADLGLRHGAPHGGRGSGDGVAAQVDHVGHALTLSVHR